MDLLLPHGLDDRRADLLGRPAREGRAHRGRRPRRAVAGGRDLPQELPEGLPRKGIRIVAEEPIAQTAQDVSEAVRKLHEAKAQAIVHCGFGFGIVFVNPALEALGWDPPRFTSTAFQNAWINPIMWNAFLGWTGIDQYDEGNLVGQRFLDQYEAKYGRRPSTAYRW